MSVKSVASGKYAIGMGQVGMKERSFQLITSLQGGVIGLTFVPREAWKDERGSLCLLADVCGAGLPTMC